MTTLEVLRGMRELLSEPTRWTQDTNARSSDGDEVLYHSDLADCWCLDGALLKLTRHDGDVYLAVRKALPVDVLCVWNDAPERTHAEVLELLDKAIQSEAAR
jgi:hypothetical protein